MRLWPFTCATLLALACAPALRNRDAAVEPVRVQACATAGADGDEDGIADACEFGLAQVFAPALIVRAGGCDWDAGARPPRQAGGYFFAAGPARTPGGIRIAYLPAYYRDCGWEGPRCRLPFVDCSPHAGDSEFLVVEVERDGDVWRVAGVFLSAHCFDGAAPDCRWYRGRDLERFGWRGVARASGPVVWVAAGRHANYPTRDACERGHRWVDTCSGETRTVVFPIAAARQNIGSRLSPAGTGEGCLTAAHAGRAMAGAASDAVECLWSESVPFRGWQGIEGGATPYGRYLREVAQF